MEGEPTFKTYYDQAIIAEQRRKSFQEIGESGAKLDPGGAACLAMLDTDQMSQVGGGSVAAINYFGGGYGSSQYGGRGRSHSNSGGGQAGQYGQSNIGGGQSGQSGHSSF